MALNKLQEHGLIDSAPLFTKGFLSSISDPSLFVLKKKDVVILLLLYVDDMLIKGNASGLLDEFLIVLKQEFAMKDQGQVHYFFGYPKYLQLIMVFSYTTEIC